MESALTINRGGSKFSATIICTTQLPRPSLSWNQKFSPVIFNCSLRNRKIIVNNQSICCSETCCMSLWEEEAHWLDRINTISCSVTLKSFWYNFNEIQAGTKIAVWNLFDKDNRRNVNFLHSIDWNGPFLNLDSRGFWKLVRRSHTLSRFVDKTTE